MANISQMPGSSQKFVAIFELIAEDREDDPALINAVRHEVIAALQQEGHAILPLASSGQKGIEGFLVELVIVLQQVATTVWNNHTAIAEGIADLSGLITILTGIVPALKRMRQAHEQLVGQQESAAHPIKITVEIDGEPLMVEASDVLQADAALKLALKYRSQHPASATQVTTKSKVKVQGQVPARKRRKRR